MPDIALCQSLLFDAHPKCIHTHAHLFQHSSLDFVLVTTKVCPPLNQCVKFRRAFLFLSHPQKRQRERGRGKEDACLVHERFAFCLPCWRTWWFLAVARWRLALHQRRQLCSWGKGTITDPLNNNLIKRRSRWNHKIDYRWSVSLEVHLSPVLPLSHHHMQIS